MQRVQNEILTPMIVAMAQRGTPFAGLLYAGLAMTAKGIRVIEFNARFGDPETQVVLTRLRSPLSKLLYAAATGTLSSHPALEWSDESAVTVVMAAAGYPAAPQTGEVISGLADIETTEVFHAGTKFNAQDEIISSGGRVLSVTATGADLTQARRNAYSALANISFSGEQHRTDIAQAAAEGRIHL
jgi:phosphoribosylamine--glycine ligase